jgi:hypothetical protein
MLKIREGSDFHIGYQFDQINVDSKTIVNQILPPLDGDKETVLLLCGDIGVAKQVKRIVNFLDIVVPRFKHVIYLFGNHEHYHSKLNNTFSIIDNAVASHLGYTPNLTIVGNEPQCISIDGVRFLCSTMWTDYGNGDPHVHELVKRHINDHHYITNDDNSLVQPDDLSKIFHHTIQKFECLLDGYDNSRTVIATHHMPSFDAVDPMYMVDPTTRVLNHAFASNLNEFIIKHKPAVWCFGHTHNKYNDFIGSTNLKCNPFGYAKEMNLYHKVYNPRFSFEV